MKHAHNGQVIHVGRVPRIKDGGEVRIDIVKWRGEPTLMLRAFAPAGRPTKYSFAIDLRILPMVRRCLDNAEKLAREINLLSEAA